MSRRAIVAVILTVLIALCAYVVYDFNGQSLDFSDRQLVLVVTDSMDGDNHDYDIGSFPANTLVMVEHLNDQEVRFLRTGDVISYESNGILEHHRIIEANTGFYYVHGDNNHFTEKVTLDRINGVVVGANSWLGTAVVFFEDNFLLCLVVMYVLCSILIVTAVYSRKPSKEVS